MYLFVVFGIELSILIGEMCNDAPKTDAGTGIGTSPMARSPALASATMDTSVTSGDAEDTNLLSHSIMYKASSSS